MVGGAIGLLGNGALLLFFFGTLDVDVLFGLF